MKEKHLLVINIEKNLYKNEIFYTILKSRKR